MIPLCVSPSQCILPQHREDLCVFAPLLQLPVTCEYTCDRETNAQQPKSSVKPLRVWTVTCVNFMKIWLFKCLLYIPDCLCRFFSCTDFIQTVSHPFIVKKKLKCRYQILTVWSSGVYSKWRIKRQTNPIKHLLHICANDCWNELKAKSCVQCWGTWLVTSETHHIILIFCKYTFLNLKNICRKIFFTGS